MTVGKERQSKLLEEAESRDNWSRGQILTLAFLCRVLLVFYGRVHDYIFEVQFTDVDYKVLSDAAVHVYHGRSPYNRATYRYSPLLAWILLPVVKWAEFGKVLFCAVDIVVALLCFELLQVKSRLRVAKLDPLLHETSIRKCLIVFWLANPLTATISARGNADVLVCMSVLCTLYLLAETKWHWAAFIHGVFCMHLKIYPVIYLPSIFVSLSQAPLSSGYFNYAKKLIRNQKGFLFVLISCSSFLAATYISYLLYGESCLKESVLYHLHRTDRRHNFSPYFYALYLVDSNSSLARIIGFCAFVPQVVLCLWFALRYSDDLAFCWFLTTLSFVSFNKVCTSQYFIWYICLLPVAQQSINVPLWKAKYYIILWLAGQALWLVPAYLFEFKGANTFVLIWMASLCFLMINVFIIVKLIEHYTPCIYRNNCKRIS